jgi:hypothetical protein
MTADLSCSSIVHESAIPQLSMLQESQETGCKQSAPCAEGKNTGALSAISDAELVAHIADCHLLMQLAKARWRGSKSSQDANEWFVWAQAKRNAIEARQAVYRERMADESTFQGEWTQEVLARASAYFERRMG